MTLEGGGAASLSICFSILSLRLSPYEPNQNYDDVKRKGVSYVSKKDRPSRRDLSRSIRAARTDFAPIVL